MFQDDAGEWVRSASWTVLRDHETFSAQGYVVYDPETHTDLESFVLVNPTSISKRNHNNQPTDEIQAAVTDRATNSGTIKIYSISPRETRGSAKCGDAAQVVTEKSARSMTHDELRQCGAPIGAVLNDVFDEYQWDQRAIGGVR
jgi:hypothetical protein